MIPADCPSPQAVVSWQGARLTPAGGCAAMVLETPPSASYFTFGGARLPEELPPHLTISVRMRRLTERADRSLEVAFPGGHLLVRDGQIGWWEDDAAWALSRIAGVYQSLFDTPMPYMMWLHQGLHAHVHFVPIWRSHGVQRYVAGGELGSGILINPVRPDDAAAALRRTEQGRTEQGRTEQGRTEQGTTEQDGAKQGS